MSPMLTASVPGDWYLDSRNIARLIRYLHDQEGISVTICADICDKPWNWSAEYEEMLRNDRELDARQGRFAYARGA